MSALAAQLATYLATRGHTLSTAQLTRMDQLLAEAAYVRDQGQELYDAVVALALADARGKATEEHWRHVRHEVAEVTLADTAFAGMMPSDITVEACIAEKTATNQGRG